MKTSELQELVQTADRRGRLARIAVGAMTALHAVSLILMKIQLDAMTSHGSLVDSIAEATANRERIRVVLLLLFVGAFASCAVYFSWLVAAVASARGVGREIGSVPRPLDAVVAYFLPIIGLYRPARHMLRLLEASDPGDLPPVTGAVASEAASERAMWSYRARTISVGLWWIAWIGGSTVSVSLLPGRLSSHGDPIAQAEATALTDALHVAAGIACIVLIGGVTAMQRERLRRVVASG